MVFSSYCFLFLFLPSLIIIYFLIPERFRNMVLLLYSLVFYSWNAPKFTILLLVSIMINWLGGLLIHQYEKQEKAKKAVLIVSVLLNCILLGYFKYSDFIIENVNTIFGTGIAALNVTLPIGISFYTFQGLSYVIDVYRKEGEYQKNPLNVALYISLFPQLVAGPIVRYDSIANQLEHRTITSQKLGDGLVRFIYGFAKKIILADTFGIMADYVFDLEEKTPGLAWIGAIAYTLQIFFDFSGYSDMAIGLGKVFGFDFIENFNYPYISRSITEFWRRWHISLSTWFRDYVYIPLGGNRCSLPRHIGNLFVVWLATGLWHGSSWNFVLWGLYFWVWLMLEKFLFPKIKLQVPEFLKWLYAILIIICSWVLFRAADLTSAIAYLRCMFSLELFTKASLSDIARYLLNYKYFFLLGIVFSTPFIKNLSRRWNVNTVVRYIMAFALFLVSLLYVIAGSYNAFIYFQF